MKGMYFTLDAIFGAIIIVTAVVLLLTFSQHDQDTSQLQQTSSDAITILNTLTMGELNSTLTSQVLATNLTNANDTVLRAIGVLWATNNSLAQPFTAEVLSTFFPRYSYAVFAEGDLLANRTFEPQSAAVVVSTAKQQVSGVAPGRPVTGNTASAFLKKIENKTTSSYVYFGGFVGQGNITELLTGVPSDVNNSSIRAVILELDTQVPFTLQINGASCGYYIPVALGNLTPDQWLINTCFDKFLPGNNTIGLVFNGTLDQSYVSGGYLRVQYNTNQQTDDPYASPKVNPLPGIQGIVNLYDSFYVPGNITSMNIYLHYLANHTGGLANNTFYLTIGNTTVFSDNTSNTTQSLMLTDVNLTTLNYSTISQRSVPIRLGFQNLSFSATYSGNANVMVATDVSGSMAWRMDWCLDQCNNTNTCPGIPGSGAAACTGVNRLCNDSSLNNSDTNRVSVARCLDKQFVGDILNLTGNLAGLVNYSTSTLNVVPLTTNLTLLNRSINGYINLSSTCICCGIKNATAQMNSSINKTTAIASGSSWKYFFANGSTIPLGNDPSGDYWHDIVYSNESTWKSGNAVLGSNENGTGPAIVTDMNNTINTVFQLYPNLWSMAADNDNGTVTFTSGINSTSNKFGNRSANTGWGWNGSVYGYDNKTNFYWSAGMLRMDINTSPGNQNNCALSGRSCSGAYGIPVNITPAIWAVLQSNGTARLSFYYQWNPNPANPFNSGADAVWVKARWTNTTGGITNLGTELGARGGDATVEVAYSANPNVVMSGTYTIDLTPLITGPGVYYFDFGGKLFASNTASKWGSFRFDNVMIGISNQTDVYYLRKNFTVNNLSQFQTGLLNLLSDDRATVYLNGQLLIDEGQTHTAQYWNEGGFTFTGTAFKSGNNEVAVRLENVRGTAKFDLKLEGLNTTKTLAMLVMTDGQSNINCTGGGSNGALTDAIQAACTAKQNWGITVNTVGYSVSADNATLSAAAACGGGLFASSANTTELSDFYKSVVINILDASVRSQSIVVSASYQPSILYNDSYIRFTHVPAYPALKQNEITVTTQSPPFLVCNPSEFINPQARVLTAQATSYSAEHWTNIVSANGITAYNLSSYNVPYLELGDPFIVNIPPTAMVAGANSLFMQTADSPSNTTGCSQNDTLISTLAIPLSTTYTPVLTRAVGCTWIIEHDDRTFQTIPVPQAYVGGNFCSYTNTTIIYDAADAYDTAVYSLLRSLDYDSDGRIFISLAEENIEIIVNKVSNVPYLWGPSLFEVRVWQ